MPVDLSVESREARGEGVFDEAEGLMRRHKVSLKYPTATLDVSPNNVLRERCDFSVIHRPVCSIPGIDTNFTETIDIDAFCPSIAPGTGTPSHGGFLYYEVLEILQALAKSHNVVGIDLVEVAPDYDPTGSTAILAAQVLLNFLGFIFHNRG